MSLQLLCSVLGCSKIFILSCILRNLDMVSHTSELEDVLLLFVYFRFHVFPNLRFLCTCVVLHISKVVALLV